MEILTRTNKIKWRKDVLISVATEGWMRIEWAHARFGQVYPVNWAAQGFDVKYHAPSEFTAIGYSIDDAYNMITKKALDLGVKWLVVIEDDVLIPPNFMLMMSEHIDQGDVPIVSGLYYTKSEPAQPLIFRGRGNGAFHDWDLGDRVWCDGFGMGALLIHTSILKYFWDNLAEPYKTHDGLDLKRVFETPRKVFYDPEAGGVQRFEGTQDLYFYDRLMENDVLAKTGWEKVAEKKYPLLCDTKIFCRHICRQTGRTYP